MFRLALVACLALIACSSTLETEVQVDHEVTGLQVNHAPAPQEDKSTPADVTPPIPSTPKPRPGPVEQVELDGVPGVWLRHDLADSIMDRLKDCDAQLGPPRVQRL